LTLSDQSITNTMLDAIDQQLRFSFDNLLAGYPPEFRRMLDYQLGIENTAAGNNAKGKRVRPLFVLLACQACGGDLKNALPAAVAVELLHNFSLVHDDIQDLSETRRGRETIWVKWGKAQAINTGDALLTISFLSLDFLEQVYDAKVIDKAKTMLHSACLSLTKGQFLDIYFEKERNISLDLYWEMVSGKTSSLISTCMALGAFLAGGGDSLVKAYSEFGECVGNAFQVQDDYLGIWGSPEVTGKSAYSDLMSRKKTYPVVLGLKLSAGFSEAWMEDKLINENLAQNYANLLVRDGIDKKVKEKFHQLYDQAFLLLDDVSTGKAEIATLRKVIEGLLNRIK
jgi:geranylgeranyl diphosphate synthase type I